MPDIYWLHQRRGDQAYRYYLISSLRASRYVVVYFLGTACDQGLVVQAVDAGVPPRVEVRQERMAGTTESWRAWYEAREVEEWIQSVAGVLDQGWNDQ